LRLHAVDLQVPQAWLEQGARRLDAKVRRLDAEAIALGFARPLAAGPARLALRFTGTLQDKAVTGLFRQQDAGRWYAMTQFESTHARLAFPLFDEPGWKVPWTLSLTVPQALTAASNMPVVSETPTGTGWKTVRFAATPPLPSYLLAFAVGEFDVLEAGTTGPTSQTPMRFLTPAGRGLDAAYAASVTGPIVERLEAYFGLPHPYPKLDSLAIPVTVNFGAMEHAGLVTYASALLLAPPAEVTQRFQRNCVALAAHELAHPWFGNLVTMAWWDDLWLNEPFASWLGDRITAELMPAWGWDTAVQQSRAQAMRTDRLVSTRRIAEPVRTDDELANGRDSITYEKGQVVLAMFEQWLGPDRFQAGVRRYIARHAWGHATGDDFAAALAAEDSTLPAALPLMAALMARPDLPVAERLAGLDDARGLSEAGDLSAAAMLALAESQATHADRRVVEQALVLLRAGRPLVDVTQPTQVAA
jgi:alanyl aminopeptidase